MRLQSGGWIQGSKAKMENVPRRHPHCQTWGLEKALPTDSDAWAEAWNMSEDALGVRADRLSPLKRVFACPTQLPPVLNVLKIDPKRREEETVAAKFQRSPVISSYPEHPRERERSWQRQSRTGWMDGKRLAAGMRCPYRREGSSRGPIQLQMLWSTPAVWTGAWTIKLGRVKAIPGSSTPPPPRPSTAS